MDPTEDMCKSLVRWLQKLVPNKSRNISEICDGVAIVEALVQIEPQYFGKLEAKIKKDAGANWRLRVSNLKKISEAVLEYYQDVLTLQVLDNGKPDVSKIGESNDPVQLAKLLRLILGCAINCERKQEYITLMMEMEETVQQNIMQAIQQLEEVTGGPGRTGLSLLILDSDARVAKLVSDLESSNETREALTLQNQQLEQQVQILNEEKRNLEQQLENLHKKESRSPDTRKQMELLKEELFKAEVMRDDFKAKLYEQEKQMLAYQEKIAELQIAASDSSRLKDEVDALSESAGKVNDLEQTVASYKKRLENYQDLKKQVQKLEEKNMEYLQKNMELEEELNKKNTWRTQCEAFKNQILELQQKLDEETQKSDKAQFNLENLEAKMKALQAERDRLLVDRDSLREENEELKLGTGKAAGAAVSQELTPADLKERLRFLERENKTLRGAQQELDTKQSTLEQALGRAEKLQQQNRTLNQNILKLEAQLEELRSPEAASSSNANLTVKKLQEALAAKEHELQVAQTRYQRNVIKAKEVAAQLQGVETARGVVAAGTMSLTEENLITAAFYKLCGQLQRGAADERLAALAPQGSFLSRQRQPVPRKLPAKFTPSKSK
ncbi:protein hook [Anthonomus grandis grandis]|uniref:protein hook n=1 Tax=Anthonomus grandis grandis TaxID=2921223 RepID=UPI002165E20C|nr:protein hook [Anthonomus grandis grandis]